MRAATRNSRRPGRGDGPGLQLDEVAARGAVAQEDVAQGRDEAAEPAALDGQLRELGDRDGRERDAPPEEDDLGVVLDDGLAVEREADVELEAVGAVGLGPVEALEGVLERLRRGAAVPDDARDAAREEVHRRDYPRLACPALRVLPPRVRFPVPLATIDWLVSRENPGVRGRRAARPARAPAEGPGRPPGAAGGRPRPVPARPPRARSARGSCRRRRSRSSGATTAACGSRSSSRSSACDEAQPALKHAGDVLLARWEKAFVAIERGEERGPRRPAVLARRSASSRGRAAAATRAS